MAGTINIPLLSVFNDKGIKDAIKGLGSLGTSLEALKKHALGAYTGFQLLDKSMSFIGNSVNAARDLQRNMAGVDTIFGSSSAQMKQFIATSESMGMSQAQAAQAVTFLGSVFKQTGMPMAKVMEQTKTMVSLGADLASTYGYSVQEALTAMTATFRGEYDPIEKFGVAMKQQQVNAQLAAMGLNNLKGSALLAAQQQVRYNMILQRTTDAQGAFSRNSNNLFEQQQILNAVFTDLQATLGQRLIPAFTSLLGAIGPLLTNLAPSLVAIFDKFAEAIVYLTPSLNTLGESLVGIFTSLLGTLTVVGPLIVGLVKFLTDNLPAVLIFVGAFKMSSVIYEAVAAVKAFQIATEGATVAQGIFNLVMSANPIMAVVTAIGLLIAGFVTLNNLITNGHAVNNNNRQALLVGEEAVRRARASGQFEAAALNKIKQDAIDKFNRENIKITTGYGPGYQYAPMPTPDVTVPDFKTPTIPSTKLSKKAASDAAAKKAAAAAAKAAKEAAAAIKAIADETQAGLQKVADDLKATYDKMVTDAKAFTDNFSSVTDAFKALADTAPVLGAFEQQTSDALQSLRDQAKDAFGKGLFGTGITADNALSELNKLVAGQEQALTDYARQRDVLAKKIDIARQISGSILSYGNITSTLNNIKKDVIQTTTQIIDGVSVSISQSVNDIKAADLVGEYQKILDKTKDFAKNLKVLKAAGLDSGLFKQIVDAGVDAGGATAAAIVSGGADTITELNSLFADLQTTGSDIAATTTDIMYNNGGEIVNGFIDGLLADDARLKKAAGDLAATFSVTFTNSIMNAIQAAIDAAKQLSDQAAYKAATGAGDLTSYIMGATAGMTGAALQNQLNMLNGSDVSAPGSFMNTLGYMSASQAPNTTVNLTVDGKVLATSLLTYERTNGAIYVRAI